MTDLLERPVELDDPAVPVPCCVNLGWLGHYSKPTHPADYWVALTCGCAGGMCRRAYFALDRYFQTRGVGHFMSCDEHQVAIVEIANARPLGRR